MLLIISSLLLLNNASAVLAGAESNLAEHRLILYAIDLNG